MPNRIPHLDTSRFLPGLGGGQQHVVGADGVGINIITATLVANTAQTIAELVASPPNTVATACGPVVHSLGRSPSLVLVQQLARNAAMTGLNAQIAYQYVTADNSAVYLFAKSFTGGLVGVATLVAAIP